MAVRLDNVNDERFGVLGMLMGFDPLYADDLGRGIMARIYEFCTKKHTYFLSDVILTGIGKRRDFAELLIQAELGERQPDGLIRIKGTEGRIEWLADLQQNKVRAGQARALNAKRDEKGRLKPSNTPAEPADVQQASSTKPSREPAESSVLTLTPTLSLTTKDLSEGSAARPPTRSKRVDDGQKRKEFIAAMVPAYQERYPGLRPILDGPVQGAIKRLLAYVPVQSAIHMYQVYLQLDDPWFKKKSHDFATFMANLQTVANSLNSGTKPTGIDWQRVFADDARALQSSN